jgi:hypothetical protein
MLDFPPAPGIAHCSLRLLDGDASEESSLWRNSGYSTVPYAQSAAQPFACYCMYTLRHRSHCLQLHVTTLNPAEVCRLLIIS